MKSMKLELVVSHCKHKHFTNSMKLLIVMYAQIYGDGVLNCNIISLPKESTINENISLNYKAIIPETAKSPEASSK